MTTPAGDESVRWERVDGRWVSITLAADGTASVRASSGERQMVPSFADAMALAERLRLYDS